MQTRGEGVKKSKYFVDIINGIPLRPRSSLSSGAGSRSDLSCSGALQAAQGRVVGTSWSELRGSLIKLVFRESISCWYPRKDWSWAARHRS